MSFATKIEYWTSTKMPTLIGARIYNLIARSMFINTVLAGFFSWVAFRGSVAWDSIIVDFLITNIFLIFFLLVGSRNDLRDWTEKQGIEKLEYDAEKHKKIVNMTEMSSGKLFLYGFVKYGIKYGIVYMGGIYLIYNVILGLPSPSTPGDVAIILFFKLVWLVFLTDECTRKAGIAGAIDPKTIK